MRDGKIVRFEEITRTPLEVQDCLLGMLSDRVMTVPELTGEASQLYAREGFNIIATANTRDRGVNEMSAAPKRRFDFETVFPIMDFAQELELVASASARLLAHSGIPHKVPDAVLELLVRTFRDLRANGEKKTSMDTLTAIMSTAEAVNVAHAVGVRAWFLANRAGSLPTWWTVLPEPSSKITKKIALVCAVTSNSVSPHIKKLTGRLIIKPATACREERGMSEPLIVGIRHHSPACARLVKSLIESQRPRYVLIEGPADFNDRVDELFLAHQLPVAIYSYCQYQDGAAPGVVPGRHLLNFRRSGRRYKPHVVFRHKLTSSICLAGRRVKKRTIRLIRKMKARPYCCVPPAWITAIPCGITCSKMKASKLHYPLRWRTILPNCGAISPAMHSIVSAKPLWLAGLHGRCSKIRRRVSRLRWLARSGTGKMWRECPQDINTPELPSLADAITGCYLTPYSEKRLDVLAGYLSGMPAPVWQNWCWQWGLQQAGEQLLKRFSPVCASTTCLLRPRIWLPHICMQWHWHSCAVIHYRYALTGWMP